MRGEGGVQRDVGAGDMRGVEMLGCCKLTETSAARGLECTVLVPIDATLILPFVLTSAAHWGALEVRSFPR